MASSLGLGRESLGLGDFYACLRGTPTDVFLQDEVVDVGAERDDNQFPGGALLPLADQVAVYVTENR